MQTITRHFINGDFVDFHGAAVVEVRNPTNNELIGRVTMGTGSGRGAASIMIARQLLAAGTCASIVLLSEASSAPVQWETLPVKSTTAQLRVEGELPALGGAIAWINSPPLTVAALRGKVVLIDFWTYTCINWRRTLPYVRAWAEKYKDRGLVVIGVHTPEFTFEKALENLHREMPALDIHYPVAVDSDYVIWRAFRNQYWPAVYIADAQGRIRHHQFGEGGYGETERIIQQLLSEAGQVDVPGDLVSLDPQGRRSRPTGQPSSPLKPTSAMKMLNPLPHPAVGHGTGRASTRHPIDCDSTSGRWWVTGRSEPRPRRSAARPGGSCISSTRATLI